MNKISTGAAIAMLSSPGLAAALMADGNLELRIFAGAVPASADAATGSATMLVAIKTGGSAGLSLQMSGAVLSKPSADTWLGSVVAAGRATFYRLMFLFFAFIACLMGAPLWGAFWIFLHAITR
ncbi:hypothetical protein [Comamonas sp. 26]|uniref:hypothetical protein n=1 Tax=Comamonas sp. 26 TaxID=2035201 RepID=UPI000C189768|nr:hypothetical protein [Comamonas sp. 26]PIG07850.1 hypothetical protein CLU84_0677 [Comamonas sp. 26]